MDWPSLGERSLPASFVVPGEPAVTVQIGFEESADGTRRLGVSAEAEFEPPADVLSDLRSLSSLDDATEATRAYGDEVRARFLRAAGRVVGVLAWRTGDPLMPSAGTFGPSEFFIDGAWNYVPMTVSARLLFSSGTQLTPKQLGDVSALLAEGLSEPLPHTVWREAWRLREASPRGALFLGVSALEIGVKEFIAHRVPEAEWLVQEVQTPPLMKLLQSYLPELTRDDPTAFARLEPPVSTTVDEAVRRRNDAAHSSKPPLLGDDLKGTLRTLREVIYRLDSQEGHDFTSDQAWGAN